MTKLFFTLHLTKAHVDTVLENRAAIKAVDNETLTEVLDECIDAVGGTCYQNGGSLSLDFEVVGDFLTIDFSQFKDDSGIFAEMAQGKTWTEEN